MEALQALLTEVRQELHDMRKEMVALRIEIERGKAGVTTARVIGGALVAVFMFFIVHQVNTYDHWNELQDAQIQQLSKARL